MKASIRFISVIVAILAGILASNLRAQDSAPPKAPTISAEKSILVTVTAKVEAIDHAKREVKLKGSLGNVVAFTVDKHVKRLDEVKVGDEVTADYYVSIAGEVREPTQDEKDHPFAIVEGGARAPKDTAPATGVLRAFKVVATVIGLDLPTQSVTLQGPLGNSGTIRLDNVDKLKQLRLGDTVIVTYTEALAVSLQKTERKHE